MLKVGDKTSSGPELAELPEKTVILDDRGVAWQKRKFNNGKGRGWIGASRGGHVRQGALLLRKTESVIIIHLPEVSE